MVARSMVSSWLQEGEAGRWCLQPHGAQGQGGDAWCGVFTTWRLASWPGDLKVTMLAPDGQPGPVKGQLPFFQR